MRPLAAGANPPRHAGARRGLRRWSGSSAWREFAGCGLRWCGTPCRAGGEATAGWVPVAMLASLAWLCGARHQPSQDRLGSSGGLGRRHRRGTDYGRRSCRCCAHSPTLRADTACQRPKRRPLPSKSPRVTIGIAVNACAPVSVRSRGRRSIEHDRTRLTVAPIGRKTQRSTPRRFATCCPSHRISPGPEPGSARRTAGRCSRRWSI